MILIFDLDDTLYPEITYVISGFHAVSLYLEDQFSIDAKTAFTEMKQILDADGREKIFNTILERHNICSLLNIKKCLSVYRNHQPDLALYPEAEICLERFKQIRKYIITDGNILVQRNKIRALKLNNLFIKTIPTYQYGQNHSKPSILCFKKILQWERCEPKQLVYIGDNPSKDFINIKKIGIKTIRVFTGEHKSITLDNAHEADFSVKSLDELDEDLIKKIYEN